MQDLLRTLSLVQIALKAYQLVSKLENISPSLEPSHAFAEAIKIAPKLKSSDVIIVNSCGDSIKDKDIIKKKLGKYNLKFKYSADRDLFYRMIIKYNLVGKATKRSEVFGKFNLFGVSSRVPFIIKVLEETRIRLFNKQNFIQVLLVITVYMAYNLMKKTLKKLN